MNTHKLITLLLAAIFASSVAEARELSPSQALDRAMPGIKTKGMHRRAVAPRLQYTEHTDGTPTVYVFSLADDGKGYLVLPADDVAAASILGYSDTGRFNPDSIPENMAWWLSQYGAEISAMGSSVAIKNVTHSGAYPIGRPAVEPIVKTRWNQIGPYAALCPTVNGQECPSGCVATAMAQVMNVWKYPTTGTGSHSYYSSAAGGQLSVDFSATTYDWDKMTDTYNAQSSDESINAVATLMYNCGVAVDMNYGPNQSSSNYTLAADALIKYFNYDKGLRDLSRNYFEIEEWNDIIYNELAAGRPILYGGSNDNGGHAFICDGYRPDGYFHINWGWSGNSDGYFLITALNPQYAGPGGSIGGYNLNQTMIVGIRPPVAGSETQPVIQFMSDMEFSSDAYDRLAGSAVTVLDTRGIYNMSVANVDLIMGLKLIDYKGNVSYVEGTQTVSLKKGAGFKSYTIPRSSFPIRGRYMVTPAVRNADGTTWYDAYIKMANVREYMLDASRDSLIFSPLDPATVEQTDLSINTSLYPGQLCSITARLTNVTTEEYYRQVTPVLERNNYEVGIGDPLAIDLLGGESCEYEWITSFWSSIKPGDYTLYLIEPSGRKLGEGIPVTVKAQPRATAKATVAGVTINGQQAFGNTASAPVFTDLSDVTVTMTVEGVSGYYAQIVNGAVWYSESQGVTGLGGHFIGLDSGEKADITVHHDLSFLDPNHVYLLYVKGEVSGALGDPVYFKADPAAGITQIDTPERVTIFTDGTTMHAAGPAEIAGVEIYDLSGIRVAAATGPDADITSLRPGVYCVNVRDIAGTITPAKLLKH